MMGEPFFSVVVPTYNRLQSVKKAVESVLTQSCRDFELIVVDDGSTDGTGSILASITDERFRYLQQVNSGGAKARNAGIDVAKGVWIAFLDSDDEYLPNKLQRIREFVIANDVDVVYSQVLVNRGEGVTALKPTRGLLANERVDEYLFCDGQTIQTSSIVVRASVARKVRFLDGLKKGQDLDFSVRLAASGARFGFLGAPLAIWNDMDGAGRVSHRRNSQALEQWLVHSGHLLSTRALYGFRSNVLSFDLAEVSRMRAAAYVAAGWLKGGVSLKRSLHSLSRALIPGRVYRLLVDSILRAGQRLRSFR